MTTMLQRHHDLEIIVRHPFHLAVCFRNLNIDIGVYILTILFENLYFLAFKSKI